MAEALTVLTVPTTTDSAEKAAAARARGAVEARLAACAQISAPVTSVYRWKNAIETDGGVAGSLQDDRGLLSGAGGAPDRGARLRHPGDHRDAGGARQRGVSGVDRRGDVRRERAPGPRERRLPFFVYGTLRPGERNHDLFLRGRTASGGAGGAADAVLYDGPGLSVRPARTRRRHGRGRAGDGGAGGVRGAARRSRPAGGVRRAGPPAQSVRAGGARGPAPGRHGGTGLGVRRRAGRGPGAAGEGHARSPAATGAADAGADAAPGWAAAPRAPPAPRTP